MHSEISIVLCGSAGQGVQTVESALFSVLKSEGYHIFASKEYMSRVRGGSNSTEIRIGTKRPLAFARAIDILLPFDRAALEHLAPRITKDTLILADTRSVKKISGMRMVDVPFVAMAEESGNVLYVNTVAAGVVLGVIGADISELDQYLEKTFSRKGDAVVQGNKTAAERGYKIGQHLAYAEHLEISLARDPSVKDEFRVNGTDAIGMGAIAGGCNFIASYPMSPSTGVLQFLAEQSARFGIAVEQAEDEIAAINMGLGASYAGARAMVTTSGGGFALMCEGVSLAGMIETPIVIHIAQRPGPATGLPTRTEQGDLNLALYSGHGEFPRAIFAPGSHEEAFRVTQEAFRVADHFQIPVFLLSDQYFLDSMVTTSANAFPFESLQSEIVETSEKYLRYQLTKDGISPRGIPGHGMGLVVVDSDEHTEDGHLTEDLRTRVDMMEKRWKKLKGMMKEVVPPVHVGSKSAKTVLIGWGSTHGAILEALEKSERDDIAYFHFAQVYPLPKNIKTLFKGAKNIVVIENNYSGQFADLLEKHGVKVSDRILKYNGEPFSVEELASRIKHFE